MSASVACVFCWGRFFGGIGICLPRDAVKKYTNTVHTFQEEPDAKPVTKCITEITKEGWISSVSGKTARHLIVAEITFKNDPADFAAAWEDLLLTGKALGPFAFKSLCRS